MGGPSLALQALRSRVLRHASGANAAGFKGVPLEPAIATPFVLRLRFPAAKRAANLRASKTRIRFVLLFRAGLTGKYICSRFHHNRLSAGKWLRHI